MTYEIGVVYVWQNQVGRLACLNGLECVVIGPAKTYFGGGDWQYGWPTDSQLPDAMIAHEVMAFPGDLRRKQPPTGLATVLAWFTAPAPREVETA